MSYVVAFQCHCREQFDNQSTDGIVTEACGHSKCRKCFIKESGCVRCLSTKPHDDQLPPQPSVKKVLDSGDIMHMKHVPAISKFDSGTGRSLSNPKDIRILEEVIIKVPSNGHGGFDYPRLKEPAKFKYPSHITRQLVNGKLEFECTICKKKFRSKSNRKYHLYCDDSVEKPFNCSKCSKTFATRNHLEYHENRHNNVQYKCDECDRTFLSRVSLQKHSKVHTNDFRYVCDHCDRKFYAKSDLILHMYSHKTSPLPFQCDECDKSFSAKFKLNQHIMTHQGVKSHACQFCGKKFTRNSSLTIHLLTHSSMDTKYECNVCSKSFDRQRSHDRHMKIKHGSTVFQCPLCDVQSGRKDNILRHIRNLHSAEKFEEIIKKISKTVARVPVPDAIEQSVIVANVGTKKEVATIQTPNVFQYQSVIRFAGRSAPERLEEPTSERSEKQMPDRLDIPTALERSEETTTIDRPEIPTMLARAEIPITLELPEIPVPVRTKTPTPIRIVVNDEYSSDIDTSTNEESIDNSDNIQPNRLNKELHVELAEPTNSSQTVSNISIYRQLLSPYLRPPPNLDHRNGAQEPERRRGYQVQGDRLPKRKENVEIYRSILMSSDDQEPHQTSVIQDNRPDVVEENVKSTTNPTSIVIHGQSSEYFSEMHWRKRTSQCFNRMEQ
ncbi:zinc finger and BTB domain-containing protein 24-like [Bradysia coprophila]|uniref:zinc finger and BTB domain-containing protein 24-like n=1 Tax=Bradysia coprophila TaxID=38358 RepID=UPI00187DB7E5|nr:zinc finger and BTB domain-containing protein 24-like [Bradysia coprophila]